MNLVQRITRINEFSTQHRLLSIFGLQSVLPLSIRLWARRINITTRIVYNNGFLENNNYKELIY